MKNKLLKDKDIAGIFNGLLFQPQTNIQNYCFQIAILMKKQTNVLQEMEHTIVNTVTYRQMLL